MHPQPFTAVPEETARVARAAFPQGNLYMQRRDELGVIYNDSSTPTVSRAAARPRPPNGRGV